MRSTLLIFGAILLAEASAISALAQSLDAADKTADAAIAGPLVIDPSDLSGAQRFLDEPGELITLYGSRRFGPYYERGRPPPATDPQTGWPLDMPWGPFFRVGGVPFARPLPFSPYGWGFSRSLYRPWYAAYGYGYGWGYRYPFGFSPWYARRFDFRPWYADGPYAGQLPQVDYGPTLFDIGAAAPLQSDFGGCFYW